MKYALIKDVDDIVFREMRPLNLEVNEIRIKIDACGICGTDVANALKSGKEYKPFGHEVAGTVLEIGNGVENISVGQKIVIESSTACGRCENCRNAQQSKCSNIISFWPKPPYGFGEEMVLPAISAVPYDKMLPEHACLSEPLGVAIDMFKLAEIGLGTCVMVSGLGPIGLMAIRLAKLAGAQKIYACDFSKAKKRIELAKIFGADEVIAIDQIALDEYKFLPTPDRFMVTSPPKTLESIIKIAPNSSIISYIGIGPGTDAEIRFNANVFHFNKLQLRGSFASPALYTPMALDMIRNGVIDANLLITHMFLLEDLPKAMNIAVHNIEDAVKVIIKP